MSHVLIVGGTAGIGRELAAHYLRQGARVTIAGRDAERAAKIAAELDPALATGLAADLGRPGELVTALQDVPPVDYLVLAGMERDLNTVAEYDVERAVNLATVKLVGYTTVVHALYPKMPSDGSVLLFGGMAKDAPYPGSTTVSTVNAAMVGLVSTLSLEIAPIRVNAIHAGPVEDSPFWAGKEAVLDPQRQRTLTGRLPRLADVVEGCVFLLENPAANNVNLSLDGGRR